MKKNIHEEEDKRFVNPYNFVPFMGTCNRSAGETDDERYTGYLECGIKLLTPLFIPNTSSDVRLLKGSEKADPECQREKWRGYDFASYDDWSGEEAGGASDTTLPPPPQNPVIYASALRGALRSVHEAAFNGCMSSISVRRLLSRRTNEAKKPGILKKQSGKWVIYPCKRAMIFVEKEDKKEKEKMGKPVSRHEYDAWKEGQELWIKTKGYEKIINRKSQIISQVILDYRVIKNSTYIYQNKEAEDDRKRWKKEGYTQGWLHKGEDFPRKHHESVFYNLRPEKKPIKVPHASDIEALGEILKTYKDKKKNQTQNHKGYPDYEVISEGTCVYFSQAGGHFYLSPACIGREVYSRTLEEILESNGGYQPCNSKELCPTCRIFGMVGEKGAYAYGSKVRVTDAVLLNPKVKSEELFEKPIILPELGEPKPGAVEFYTKPPYQSEEMQKDRKGFWTYDYKYKVVSGEISKEKKFLEKGELQLRGRKFYWHKNVELKEYAKSDIKLSSMRQRIRPMKATSPESGPMFSFRIYFEELNREQLKQLKWVVDFGNKDCAHKIGRAKPLGFGSVQMSVNALYLREIDVETGEWKLEKNTDLLFAEPLKENKPMRMMQIIANWKERPEGVNYPLAYKKNSRNGEKGQNDTASHQWFTRNKDSISRPNFFKVLPTIQEDADKNLDEEKALYMWIKKDKGAGGKN